MTAGSDCVCGTISNDSAADEVAGLLTGGPDRPKLRPSFVVTVSLVTLVAVAVTIACWGLLYPEALDQYVRNNELRGASGLSPQTVVYLAAALAGSVTATLYGFWPRLRPLLYVLGRRTSPLILVAFLPSLLDWKLWVDRALVHLLFSVTLVLATKQLVQFALNTPDLSEPVGSPSARWHDWSAARVADLGAMRKALPKSVGFWLVLLGVAWYATFFSYHTIVHHRNALSASLDLGLEENLVWNVLHRSKILFKSSPFGGPNASHLGNHATWFAFLIAPFYAISQRAETLLIIQALLMGGAAIPLYLLARRFVSTSVAVLIAYVYLLYPGLHGAALYDFHYLPLGPFFLWFVLYFVERHKWFWVVIFALIACSVREDVAFALGVLGGMWLLAGRRPIAALGIMALGVGYFLVMKGVVMSRALGGGDSFVHQYKLLVPEGDQKFSGVVKTILSNPLYTLSLVLEKQKLVYFLQILLPLAFFPLRRPIGFWAATPGLLFTLFSTEYAPLLMISFQYTTYWSAQLFPVLLLNLRWMDTRVRAGFSPPAWRWSWLAAIAMGLFTTSYQYGALLQNNTVIGGFGRYHFGIDEGDLLRRKNLGKVLAMVPPNAKVVSAENIVPQIANRADSYTLRMGVYDADYIVFVVHSGGAERRHVVEALDRGTHGVVIESGEFAMAKRGASTADNERYIARMGGRHHVDD